MVPEQAESRAGSAQSGYKNNNESNYILMHLQQNPLGQRKKILVASEPESQLNDSRCCLLFLLLLGHVCVCACVLVPL